MSGLRITQPGLLSLLQDGGRFGHHRIGLSNGGPLDPQAFYWANRLCDNPTNSSCVEITIGGLSLEAELATQIAVTGAEVVLTINGQPRPLWQTHAIKPGDQLTVGFAKQGCRAYLSVTGGFRAPLQFGSSATVVWEGIGGLHGTPLQPGDLLP